MAPGQDNRRQIVVKADSALAEQIVSARQREPQQHEKGGDQGDHAGDHHRTEQNVEDDLMPRKADLGKGVRRQRSEKQIGEQPHAGGEQTVSEHFPEGNGFKNISVMLQRETAGKPGNGKFQNLFLGAEGGDDRPIEGQHHHQRAQDKYDVEKQPLRRSFCPAFCGVPASPPARTERVFSCFP